MKYLHELLDINFDADTVRTELMEFQDRLQTIMSSTVQLQESDGVGIPPMMLKMMDLAIDRMEAARRGLGIVNKLKAGAYAAKHASRVMTNMNKIRGMLRRMEKEIDNYTAKFDLQEGKGKHWKNPDYDVTVNNLSAKHHFQKGGTHKNAKLDVKKGRSRKEKHKFKTFKESLIAHHLREDEDDLIMQQDHLNDDGPKKYKKYTERSFARYKDVDELNYIHDVVDSGTMTKEALNARVNEYVESNKYVGDYQWQRTEGALKFVASYMYMLMNGEFPDGVIEKEGSNFFNTSGKGNLMKYMDDHGYPVKANIERADRINKARRRQESKRRARTEAKELMSKYYKAHKAELHIPTDEKPTIRERVIKRIMSGLTAGEAWADWKV